MTTILRTILAVYLSVLAIALIGCMIPTLYFSIQIYNKFEDKELQKKWRLLLLGNIFVFIAVIFGITANYLNDQTFRTYSALFMLALSISGPLLMYFGVGKQIDK